MLKNFKKATGMPVITFAEDVAASGGYMALLGGDEIVAEESSIVGSIGVISMLPNFDSLLKKYKIDYHRISKK